MSLGKKDIETLAEDFVIDYLHTTPEYLDIVEFVTENAEGDIEEDDITDDDLDAVFKQVAKYLDLAARAFDEGVA